MGMESAGYSCTQVTDLAVFLRDPRMQLAGCFVFMCRSLVSNYFSYCLILNMQVHTRGDTLSWLQWLWVPHDM